MKQSEQRNPRPVSTTVVSAFPGTGKSFLASESPSSVLDSDSSTYSWLSKGVRNPDFPANYIAHIRENIGKVDIILVSTHAEVRSALCDADIPFTLVYPARSLRDEYIARYRQRGSPEGFITLLSGKWDEWIRELDSQQGVIRIILNAGQYLSDWYDWPDKRCETTLPF